MTGAPVANEADVVPEPVVVVVVLSASTAGTDRIEKSPEYRATPSIERYVMLEQMRAGILESRVEMALAGLYAGLAD